MLTFFRTLLQTVVQRLTAVVGAQEEEGDWDPEDCSFSVNPGGALEQAWASVEHRNFLRRFEDDAGPLDIVFLSLLAWTTASNIPSRSVRLVRTLEGEQLLYQEDTLTGTWAMESRKVLLLTTPHTGKTRRYENLPGTQAWVRRAESLDECAWMTVLVPLVMQFEGVLLPLDPPLQVQVQV